MTSATSNQSSNSFNAFEQEIRAWSEGKKITHLEISPDYTDAHLIILLKYTPDVETVRLNTAKKITAVGLVEIAKLAHLQVLDLSFCEQFSNTDEISKAFQGKKLRCISLMELSFSDQEDREIKKIFKSVNY